MPVTVTPSDPGLPLVRFLIDTHKQATAYVRRESAICRSEGFNALSRVQLTLDGRSVVCTLNIIDTPRLEGEPEVIGVSECAWLQLAARDGDRVTVSHPPPLDSLASVRAKVYGRALERSDMYAVIRDIAAGRYSDIEITAFITACASDRLSLVEITYLTEAMVAVGERLDWGRELVLDKHCVGGLPGNRTTPVVVAIVAANGLCIPKTSSRAITSPSGTADTMATLTEVALQMADLRRVVEREGGCLAWGGAINLSPADDILIQVERALDIDFEGQLVASVLSKKKAAGSTHVLIDIPVGRTAKVRDRAAGEALGTALQRVGEAVNLQVLPYISDGSRPVGRGVGPALEAHDLLAVLHNHPAAPQDLRKRALDLAAQLLEMGGAAPVGGGQQLAEATLVSGAALRKFEAICEGQGGLRQPPVARHQRAVTSERAGWVRDIDNRVLARVAKLAGAPDAPAAGLSLAANVDEYVEAGGELFTLHAETPGELAYALDYYRSHPGAFTLVEEAP